MYYCWECGERLNWEEVFCPECGADQSDDDLWSAAYDDSEDLFRDDEYYP